MWIEISKFLGLSSPLKSRPARALWIEICSIARMWGYRLVEAREGLVD